MIRSRFVSWTVALTAMTLAAAALGFSPHKNAAALRTASSDGGTQEHLDGRVELAWHLPIADVNHGDLTGLAVDTATNDPMPGVDVDIYLLDGTLVDTQVTDGLGKFVFADLVDADFRIEFSAPGFKTLDLWTNVTLDQITQLPTAWMIREPIVYHGNINGKVTDVLSGNPISGVTLDFRDGMNPPTTRAGALLGQHEPGRTLRLPGHGLRRLHRGGLEKRLQGRHVFRLRARRRHRAESGLRLVAAVIRRRIAHRAHVGGRRRLISIRTSGRRTSDASSPIRSISIIRTREAYGGTGCSSYFALDLDDTSSFGPETTSIYVPYNGTYRFLVQDYTNRSCSGVVL
ncbi:MAG: carboxypeptidase-like regulatory domain-containing protein [Deltaproteobacteria bacterium]|nr:carboxypeptidase-like regulatory domain-containing protein [Deltaproteobacteria bacterium]